MDHHLDNQKSHSAILLQQLREGRESAFAELFDMFSGQLLRIIRFRLDRRLAKRIDAEDVLQEVFVAGQQRIDNLIKSPTDSFLVWIRMIMRQTLIDLVRHHLGTQRRSVHREARNDRQIFHSQESFSIASVLVASNTPPSQAFSRKEMLASVERSLQELKESDREIIALRHFEELSNSEVAEILELTEKAASIRYIRALAKLKTALAKLNDSPGSGIQLF